MLRSLAPLTILALVALFAFVAVPRGAAQAQPIPVPTATSPDAAPHISVVGSGLVLAQPNTAHVTLGVEVFDPSLATAQSQAAQRMDAVIQRLKAAGIADTDIHTVAFNVNPQYDQPSGQVAT